MVYIHICLKNISGTIERLPRASLDILICRWETETLRVVPAYDFFCLLAIPSTYILQARKACNSTYLWTQWEPTRFTLLSWPLEFSISTTFTEKWEKLSQHWCIVLTSSVSESMHHSQRRPLHLVPRFTLRSTNINKLVSRPHSPPQHSITRIRGAFCLLVSIHP